VLGATLGLIILAALGLGFVYSQPPAALSAATPLEAGADGKVRIPLSTFQGTKLQRFQTTVNGQAVRFVAIPIEPVAKGGKIATAFDACLLCGPKGYYQQGPNITCLHCGSVIYPPSIGQTGGCNPVPLPSQVEGGDLVLQASDLAGGAKLFASGTHG
jgi:high-affinity iron transporter